MTWAFAPAGCYQLILSGEVIEAVDGVQEVQPPRADRAHMAGNHVLLRCSDAWILLGHMERGSVSVKRGQQVAAGDLIGHVGNTGNTNEPHLHIHAQPPGSTEEPFSGDPLPITLDGVFAVRNARFRSGD